MPTSGDSPYTYTAEVDNKLGIDLGLYRAEIRGMSATGACPVDVSGATNNQAFADALVYDGVNISTTNVPTGSCRRTVFLIRRLSDNAIVSQMSVDINNV